MAIEAQPGAMYPDKKAKKEWSELFGSLLDDSKARIVGLYIDILLRLVMSVLFFWITRTWLLTVLEILEKQTSGQVKLSDTVLVTLLSTTTLNVLGLLLAVAVYLFPRKVEEKVAAVVAGRS